MNEEIYLNTLSQLDWEDIYPSLLAYTNMKLSSPKYYFRHGIQKKDLAQETTHEAIKKLFNRKNDWNREKYPTAIEKLKSIVDSMISNLLKSYEYKHKVSGDKIIFSDNDNEITLNDTFHSSDNFVKEIEDNEIYQNLIKSCENSINDDDDLSDVFVCMREGMQNKEIADFLGCKLSDVENRKKRLRRRLKKILE